MTLTLPDSYCTSYKRLIVVVTMGAAILFSQPTSKFAFNSTIFALLYLSSSQHVCSTCVTSLLFTGKDDDNTSMTSELSAEVQGNPAGKTKETSFSKGTVGWFTKNFIILPQSKKQTASSCAQLVVTCKFNFKKPLEQYRPKPVFIPSFQSLVINKLFLCKGTKTGETA